jgi:hypothetical protein
MSDFAPRRHIDLDNSGHFDTGHARFWNNIIVGIGQRNNQSSFDERC